MKAEKDFLVGCLTRAGIKSQVLKSWKELERYADSHVGAVLSEGQVLARDGSKRNYTDQSGVRCTRTCIYTVDSKFKVVTIRKNGRKAFFTPFWMRSITACIWMATM